MCPESETVTLAVDTNCPKCGRPARAGKMVGYRKDGDTKPVLTHLYGCVNGCEQKVPYPGNGDGNASDWPVEFVILDGAKQICRPGADEFA